MKTGRLFTTLTFGLGLTLAVAFFSLTGRAAPDNPVLDPPRNSHTAPPTTTISITYDEPISAATVTSRTFAVHRMQSGLVTATHGVSGGKIIVTPTRPFHQGELVYAIATTGTLGLDGTEPLSATQWQFRAGQVVSRCFGGFTDIGAVLTDVYDSSVAWGDYDNDGDLDILLTGDISSDWPGPVPLSRVYRNDGPSAGSGWAFTDIGAVLTGVYFGSVAWGDYDNDGDLDILFAGGDSSDIPVFIVYRNDGGSFTDTGVGPTDVWGNSVAWGDYDNDGDLDILLAGMTGDNPDWTPASRVYRNDDGSFNDIGAVLTDVFHSSVAWGDYDSDGDLDILLTGLDNSWHSVSQVYRNDGGSFADIGAGLLGVIDGSVAWGDYDNDGDLDILLTGDSWGSGPASRVYRNDDGSFIDIEAGLADVVASSAAWGDHDNDGDLDILLTGASGSHPDWILVSRVYRNDGPSASSGWTFTDIDADLPDVGTSSVAWGDYDNDGDLDILLTGSSTIDFPVPISRIYRNDDCSPDLALVKAVTPQVTAPGEPITYTLAFSNGRTLTATHIVITDVVPVGQVGNLSYTMSSGVAITDTGASPPYVWNVQDLAPGQGGVITITGVLNTGLPAGAFANTAIIVTTAMDSDPSNNSDTAVVAVVNVLPVAANDDYTTDEDVPLVVVAPGTLDNDTDANGDPLTAVLDSGPVHGTLNLNPDGSFTYTPTLNLNGVVVFTYHADDGAANSDVATVIITMTAVNDAPVAMDDGYATDEDTPLAVAAPGVLGNDDDVDGDVLAAVLDSGPMNGTLTFDPDGSFAYTPTLNFSGAVTFTYHAHDGTTDSNTATVTVVVNERSMAYICLPLILKSRLVAPDLVVQSTAVTGDNVEVVIENRGNGPVNEEFWVDVYVNPDPVPTTVNEIWHDGRSDQGLAWAVTASALPLAPGDVLTLTVGDAYYSSEHSWVSWPLPADAPIYVQVDSYNAATTHGAVLEDHELTGEEYNNISGPVHPSGKREK